MNASNTARAYGWVARFFHWTVAALILAAIALGLYAGSLPKGGEAQLQAIFQTYSVHKTVGVTALTLAVLRILWTLTQKKPLPLHPGRRLEGFVAETVHWGLWIGMIIMPISGWLLHSAAPGGFARILWPLGQRLPMVPEDAALAERFAAFHKLGWLLLGGLILLHILGALKHVIIDRDGTLSRMAGNPERAPEPPTATSGVLPHLLAALAGIAIWAGAALTIAAAPTKDGENIPASAPQAAATSGWAVQQGTLNIEATQAGSTVSGRFDQWQAVIDYDPESQTGRVVVNVDIASLTLGAVSDTAKGPDFLNAAAHPNAVFEADILPATSAGPSHIARGRLTIAGHAVETDLPFELTVNGDKAQAKGSLQVDRRDFGIGTSYGDESTVGFGVNISFDLTAKRQ